MIIVYIANRKIYDKLPTALNSLLKNNEVEKIYLLIEDDNIDYISHPKIEFINLKNQNIIKHGFNCTKRFPYTAMTRCFLPSILPNENKVIYLDVDTTVDGNLADLWNFPLGSCYMAARFENKDYFNSGVLLMNLALMRANNSEEKLERLLTKCKFQFPDQDAMNIVFKNKIRKLPHKFNVLGRDYQAYNGQEIAIRHYAGIIKPWKDKASKKDKAFWDKYKVDNLIVE